eukprot:10704395-Alexandrium_andersonii.AAC.1
MRGMTLECLKPGLDLRRVPPDELPILTVTDCKSLYRTVHKEGCAKVPTEEWPALDLAALRQMYREECAESGSTEVLAAG